MVDITILIRDVLLNFFLILTPIYFYHNIVNDFSAVKSKLYLGLIAGFAAILCMTFPIVSGSGFLWDLRWISFMIAVLYGGGVSGSIAGAILVSYRFTLGGWQGAVNVLIVCLILFLFFYLARGQFLKETFTRKIYLGMVYAFGAFVVVILAIVSHFMLMGNMEYFYKTGPIVFLVMGLCYVLSAALYILFSENIRTFSRIKETVHHAEKVNLISELSTLFSYEIKKSLSTIKELIGTTPSSNKTRLIDEVENAERIVANYVGYTKSQMENRQTVSLNKLILEIIELIEPYSIQKKISIKSDIKKQISIYTESIKLKQALLNIVKNGADAATKGGSVVIDAEKTGNELVITISDNGIGMSAEQISSITEFNKHPDAGGIGRGLTVTQHIIDSMGGQVFFDSQIDKGTIVTLKFKDLGMLGS